MFVVVWEPKHGRGGGHQAVMDQRKAEQIRQAVIRAMPDATVRLLAAEHMAPPLFWSASGGVRDRRPGMDRRSARCLDG